MPRRGNQAPKGEIKSNLSPKFSYDKINLMRKIQGGGKGETCMLSIP